MVLPLIPLASALIPLVADLAPPVLRFLVGEKAGESAERVSDAANRVVDVVAAVAGAPVRSPEDVATLRARLTEDAELRARLQMALGQMNLEMERLDLERERAILADRQDARKSAVARANSGAGDTRANVMLVSAFVGVISIVALLILSGDVPPEVVGFVISVGGMLTRNIGSAFDFEFGSSRGSREKDTQLESQLGQIRAMADDQRTAPARQDALAQAGRIATRAQQVRAILRGD